MRRGVLAGILGAVMMGFGRRASAAPVAETGLPYPHVTVPGSQALATWERLRREGKGWPVVVGGDDALAMLAELYEGAADAGSAAVLAAADAVQLPRDLQKHFDDEYGDDSVPPPLGEWPAPGAGEKMALTIATDILTGKPLDRVHILLVPAADGSEVPAYLHWGAWNACPGPELHVALLRRWQARYGVELVGLSGDTMNLRVAKRPATRDEALDLAREHYLYCSDIVDQGTEALAPLAASLMDSDWWFFWWD